MALASCAKTESTTVAPAAVLGQSNPAQLAMRSLDQAWRDGGDTEKQRLEHQLRAFIATYPKDPESRQARLWLAWICVFKKQYDEAMALADQSAIDDEGAIADAARVVRAAVHTRLGQPELSLRLLEPLSGMIIDPLERDSWAREIIRATLQLKHHDDALKWALVWRLECPEDRRAMVEHEIATVVLDRVSRAALERQWVQLEVALQLPTSVPGRKQARTWMRSVVTERLARYATQDHDASLAQRLLHDPNVALQKNVSLKRLATIAARAETESQRIGRKIGIVLDLDDAQQRRRSSEIVTGILHTLNESPENERPQLFTREAAHSDANGYEDALNELYNEGAAIIVGGFDTPTALDLINKARPRGLTVIAFAPFAGASGYERAFWVDTSDDVALDLWRKQIKSDPERSVLVTDVDPFCRDEPRAPFEVWQANRIEQVYFASNSSCAEKFGHAAAQSTRLPETWLGPKAFASVSAWQSARLAGAIAFAPVIDNAKSDPSIEAWSLRFSRLPYYYEALGHDITVLITRALRNMPSDYPLNNAARAEALGRVSQELLRARARLWSSTDQGFSNEHLLRPTFAMLPASEIARSSFDGAKP